MTDDVVGLTRAKKILITGGVFFAISIFVAWPLSSMILGYSYNPTNYMRVVGQNDAETTDVSYGYRDMEIFIAGVDCSEVSVSVSSPSGLFGGSGHDLIVDCGGSSPMFSPKAGYVYYGTVEAYSEGTYTFSGSGFDSPGARYIVSDVDWSMVEYRASGNVMWGGIVGCIVSTLILIVGGIDSMNQPSRLPEKPKKKNATEPESQIVQPSSGPKTVPLSVSSGIPPSSLNGLVAEDGYEWLEFQDSHWWREHVGESWTKYE